MTRSLLLTEPQLLALQAHAMATNDSKLLYNVWHALGHCQRVAFEPVTVREQREAQRFCADRLEAMALMGRAP